MEHFLNGKSQSTGTRVKGDNLFFAAEQDYPFATVFQTKLNLSTSTKDNCFAKTKSSATRFRGEVKFSSSSNLSGLTTSSVH